MRERRNLLLWLIPLAMLAFIFLPPIISTFVAGGETEPKVEEKPVKPETPKEEEKKPTDKKEEEVEVEQEEEEHLRKPILELTSRTIVKLPKGSKVDYKSYIKTATDSKGNNAISSCHWKEVDNSYTETAQGIEYTFKDAETGEELRDILLIQFE